MFEKGNTYSKKVDNGLRLNILVERDLIDKIDKLRESTGLTRPEILRRFITYGYVELMNGGINVLDKCD